MDHLISNKRLLQLIQRDENTINITIKLYTIDIKLDMNVIIFLNFLRHINLSYIYKLNNNRAIIHTEFSYLQGRCEFFQINFENGKRLNHRNIRRQKEIDKHFKL